MAVYFGFPAKYEKKFSNDPILVGRRSILRVSKDVGAGTFEGWYPDLTVVLGTSPCPTLAHDCNGYWFTVLSRRHYAGGFDSERIMIPENQVCKCWSLESRIYVDGDYYDVMVLALALHDMYCIVGRDGYRLLVSMKGGMYEKRFRDVSELPAIVEELRADHESRNWMYLEAENFGNQKWRDVE